ncbi:uncharacterized protein LOC114670083 [Macaca mulatta]
MHSRLGHLQPPGPGALRVHQGSRPPRFEQRCHARPSTSANGSSSLSPSAAWAPSKPRVTQLQGACSRRLPAALTATSRATAATLGAHHWRVGAQSPAHSQVSLWSGDPELSQNRPEESHSRLPRERHCPSRFQRLLCFPGGRAQ